MANRTKKKKPGVNPERAKRICGGLLLALGVFLLVSQVSFISGERNWLGPLFGRAIPGTFIEVFGRFSAVIVSVAVACWGFWLLLGGGHSRFLKICAGFSSLVLLCPTVLALLSADSEALSSSAATLSASGGWFGFFLVQSVIRPLFGEGNVAFPLAILLLALLVVAFTLFGLKPSHFAFMKIPFSALGKWWRERPEKAPVQAPKPDFPPADILPKKASDKRPPAPDWNSDYTIFAGQAKPFKGTVGAFEGTLPVEQTAVLSKGEDASDPTTQKSPESDGTSGWNVAEREIEEKERYLKENEKRLGALEVRALRDEIAHLKQVQQMNDWENNRKSRPSIQGIVERHDENAEETPPVREEGRLAETPQEEPGRPEPTKAGQPTQYDEYVIPEVSKILDQPPEQKPDYTAAELDEISHQLEEQLENFKVKGKVLGISTGPMITRFEVEPGPGVKVSRFASLHEDLALALKAKSIRILAPIPGKSLVGVEVPNRKLQTVYCRDIFESPLFKPQPDKLIIALGKDITGNPYTMDLCRAPHVLIAGQTGSGKSVCINTLMASLLFSKTPDELRMILVDPKVVELKLYEDIPHLLSPVVTQPDEAVAALKWGCVEMDRRYEELAKWKVRNLVGYNQKRREQQEEIRRATEARKAYEAAKAEAERVEEENRRAVEAAEANGEEAPKLKPVPQVPDPASLPIMPCDVMENMPYIVIVIDELADLMMVAGKEVEKYIARIAQKARAVGIHLVIATQRPSVNVITGLIKANLPARISFKVASQVDSRTVMDRAGAEKLLGRGDMLYRSGDDPEPIRVHGGFLTDDEVERLANACADQNVKYDRLATFEIDDPSEMGENGEEGQAKEIDPLALDVARYAIERGGISASEIQRHFGVGFSRGGRIIDILERMKICGKKQGSKPREILVHSEQELFEKWQK